MEQSDLLWQRYIQVYFRWPAAPLTAAQFAVVTAYNPRSRQQTPHLNQWVQTHLKNILEQRYLTYAPLIAGDQEFDYVEPSLAIACPLEEARMLASQFEQNAIYWIEHDTLWLWPVLLSGYEPQGLGRFSARLVKSEPAS